MEARGCIEDLESRDARASDYLNHYAGGAQVAESLDIQGLFAEVDFTLSWGRCFAVIRRRSIMSY